VRARGEGGEGEPAGSVAREKSRLRRAMRVCRARVTLPEATEAAAACAERLLESPELRAARRVALYAALPDELPTRPLFEALRSGGVRVLLPRLRADGGFSFAPAERWGDLVPGRYGVLEPAPDAAAVPPTRGDVVVLPGVAFDRRGRRLGRGGGHYDRAFPPGQQEAPLLVGHAYAFQLVDAVPVAPHDRAVDAVATERGIVRAGAGA